MNEIETSKIKRSLQARRQPVRLVQLSLGALVAFGFLAFMSSNSVWADVISNTGAVDNSVTGSNNLTAQDTGVAINGDTSGSSILNNQNTITTGSNTNQNQLNNSVNTTSQSVNNNNNANQNQSYNANQNLVQPIVVSPSQGGVGGNSMLVMPRNPLPLPNANLGRSNFGLQFGLQNNPGLKNITGGSSGLGWFMQAGVNIPFGKIPAPYNSRNNTRLDDIRQNSIDRQRQIFGNLTPQEARAATRVQGKVVGLQAYNYSPITIPKLNNPEIPGNVMDSMSKPFQPKVLAVEPGEIYNRPLNTGEKVGVVEVGREYPYLGHTRSGWIKILLPNGNEAWTNASFEYVKFDYTQVDELADLPKSEPIKKTALAPHKNVR